MTRRRFFTTPNSIDPENHRVGLEPAEARHLAAVLRLRPGDEVFVFDGKGHEFRCVVTEATVRTGELFLVDRAEPERPESPLKLTLGVALLKNEKFDLVAQKATELGVSRIVPLLTDRSDVRLPPAVSGVKRVERWNRLTLEAAKQCGRTWVPVCDQPVEFSALAESALASEGELRIIFSERNGVGFAEAIGDFAGTKATALVGPEGGWSDHELEQAGANGWRTITLGGRILRAETAAIAVTALLQHRFGDVR
jgi:16S rRNA (uracil1498-N3)-methyltransferase